jgi:two-component system response regulator HydG
MVQILLVEDDTTFAAILENFLKKKGFEVTVRYSLKTAVEALKTQSFSLFLIDYRLGDGTGLDLIEKSQEMGKQAPCIVMTSFNDVRTAVKAIRQGVFDYITKPVNPDELLMVVNQAIEQGLTSDSIDETVSKTTNNKATTRVFMESYVTGQSKAARKLEEYIALVAPTGMSVLIRGESGTGKENVARSIHRLSKRSGAAFVSIDCGTLSNELAASELFGHIKGSFTGALTDKVGQFVEASGGTLFLDEIGNLSYDVQVKLLRALQEKVVQPVGANKTIDVDVRVIAATNEDLLGNISDGKFREDLYHRINEFEIVVPPLRDRQADFEDFVTFFVDQANKELDRKVVRLSSELWDIMLRYEWPGNLRELKNVIKRLVLLTSGEQAEISALPEEMRISLQSGQLNKVEEPDLSGPPDLKKLNETYERKLIIEVLQQVKYNKSKAAQLLNIDRKTLYNKMERYGIE